MDNTVSNSLRRESGRTFGLPQLFFLTAIFAISFTCAFPATQLPGSPRPDSLLWKILLALPEVLIGVLSLGGSALVVAQCWRGNCWPSEPGEWLLLICAARFLVGNLVETLFGIAFRAAGGIGDARVSSYLMGITYVQGVSLLFLAATCIFCVKVKRWWWRAAFIFLAISMLAAMANILVLRVHFSGALQFAAATLGRIALTVTAIVAAATLWIMISYVIDLALRIKRSRLHQIGIVTFVISAILPNLVRLVAARLF